MVLTSLSCVLNADLTLFDTVLHVRRAQPSPIVPQGPTKNIFDIAYHPRDSRRRNLREELTISDPSKEGLPPTAGTPARTTFLGMAGDFDRPTK